MNRSMGTMLAAAGAVYLAGAVIHVRADNSGRSWQNDCSDCIAASGIPRPASRLPIVITQCKAALAAACGAGCAESLAGEAYCSPPPAPPPKPPRIRKWWNPFTWF